MATEPPMRLERRKFISRLERTIEQLETPQIDLSELNGLNISFHPITLRSSDSQPSFFARYTSLPDPDDDYLEEQYPDLPSESDPSYKQLEPWLRPYDRAMAFCDYLGSYIFKGTCGGIPGGWSSKE